MGPSKKLESQGRSNVEPEAVTQPVGGLPGTHVLVPTKDMQLWGWFSLPADATGAVLVPAFSPELPAFPSLPDLPEAPETPQRTRWAFVADVLAEWGFATLVIDPLSSHESALELANGGYRCNEALIANRLGNALDWMAERPEIAHLRTGMICAEETEEAAFSAMEISLHPTGSILILGSPHRRRVHRLSDEIPCGYLVAPPTSPDAPEQVARFAAAWFSQTLRRAPAAA